jgi:hypothetical protein
MIRFIRQGWRDILTTFTLIAALVLAMSRVVSGDVDGGVMWLTYAGVVILLDRERS